MAEGEGTATARPLRIEHEGACDHAVNRVNARPRVFHGHDHHGLFLAKLARPGEPPRVAARLRPMPSHFRLYIASPEANPSPFTP